MSILEDIVKNKQRELAHMLRTTEVNQSTSEVYLKAPSRASFVESITHPVQGDGGFIAEIKKRSPSAGDLAGGQNLVAKAIRYEQSGVDALSVVTDEKYFGGSMELFRSIRQASTLPMLMKDFIIHPRQVAEAEVVGADAVLIIAALYEYFDEALVPTLEKSSLTPVIEIGRAEELSLPIVCNAHIIGVNARNLHTFDVDIGRACDIIRTISKDKIVIGFSGINSRDDTERYMRAGAKAVLVGERLMKVKDVGNAISNIRNYIL